MSVVNKYKLAALITAAAVTLAGCSGGKEEAATEPTTTTPTTRSTLVPPTTTTPATRTTTSGTGVGSPTNQELLDAINASNTSLGAKADAATAEAMAAKQKATAAEAAAVAGKEEAAGAKKEAKSAKNTALIGAILAGVGTAAGVGFGIWNLNRSKDQGEQTRKLTEDAGDANLMATGAVGATLGSAIVDQGVITADIHDKQGKQITRDGDFQAKALPAIQTAGSEAQGANSKLTALQPTINQIPETLEAQGEALNNLHIKTDTVSGKVDSVDGKLEGVKTSLDETKKSLDATVAEMKLTKEQIAKTEGKIAELVDASGKVVDASKENTAAVAALQSDLGIMAERYNQLAATLSSMLESDFETVAEYESDDSTYSILKNKQDGSMVLGSYKVGEEEYSFHDRPDAALIAKKLLEVDGSDEASLFVDELTAHKLTSRKEMKSIKAPVAAPAPVALLLFGPEAPKAPETGVGVDLKAEGVEKSANASPTEMANNRSTPADAPK